VPVVNAFRFHVQWLMGAYSRIEKDTAGSHF
jgi:hypothetical protein